MEKKLFIAGLSTSFVIHALFIGLMSMSHSPLTLFTRHSNRLEVTYQDLKTVKPKNKEIVAKDFKLNKSPKPAEKPKVEVLEKKNHLFSVVGERIKDISKLRGNLLSGSKRDPMISTLDLSRKITLTPVGATKISNPQYITYNDGMREVISRNIKRRAYTYVNNKNFESGKVYLTFVLANSGDLKQLKIIDSKTEANDYLREVAVRSIRESSPFPPFPIGFDYPEFTFNLLISFQD